MLNPIPGIEYWREPNGLWVAQMRGHIAYGKSLADAVKNVQARLAG